MHAHTWAWLSTNGSRQDCHVFRSHSQNVWVKPVFFCVYFSVLNKRQYIGGANTELHTFLII